MASWNWPALRNRIVSDIDYIREALVALLKLDPTPIENDIPTGAKRLATVNGKKQLQEYDGSAWNSVGELAHDVSGGADTATKLETARSLQVDLESSTAVTFDGSADQNAIPVTGTLPVSNGGTGQTSLDEFVVTTGNQTIGGIKTFTSNPLVKNNGPAVVLRQEDITKGTNPSTSKTSLIVMADSAGNSNVNRTGQLSNTVDADGSTSTWLYAYQFADGSTNAAGLGVYCSADGTEKYAQCPTPSRTSNDTKIATTNWIRRNVLAELSGATTIHVDNVNGKDVTEEGVDGSAAHPLSLSGLWKWLARRTLPMSNTLTIRFVGTGVSYGSITIDTDTCPHIARVNITSARATNATLADNSDCAEFDDFGIKGSFDGVISNIKCRSINISQSARYNIQGFFQTSYIHSLRGGEINISGLENFGTILNIKAHSSYTVRLFSAELHGRIFMNYANPIQINFEDSCTYSDAIFKAFHLSYIGLDFSKYKLTGTKPTVTTNYLRSAAYGGYIQANGSFATTYNSGQWNFSGLNIQENSVGYQNGTLYAIAPPAGANNTTVPTTAWVNNACVHKTGNETIEGVKMFTGCPVVKNPSSAIVLQQTDITKGTNPSDNQAASIFMTDSGGTAGENRTGQLENRVSPNGLTSVSLHAYQFTNGSTTVASLGVYCSADGNSKYATAPQLRPSTDNAQSLGVSTHRWSQLYAGTTTISTSDEREKDNIEPITDAVLDAWGDVNFQQYQFKDSVAEKGKKARLHSGVIAQRVIKVFNAHGLDATRYGLLCHDTWDAEDWDETIIDKEAVIETITIVDKEATYDDEGNELTPAVTHTEEKIIEPEVSHVEHHHTDAGDRYGIRYEEALCLEAAYHRRRADRLEARIEAIEAKITALEA